MVKTIYVLMASPNRGKTWMAVLDYEGCIVSHDVYKNIQNLKELTYQRLKAESERAKVPHIARKWFRIVEYKLTDTEQK